jgi:outer membrane murein-binding lipoprotein Lpp
MPDWLIPAAAALGGGAGLGALLKAIFDARGAAHTQLVALVDQLQEDRKADREQVNAYAAKVDVVLEHLQIEREYTAVLLAWGLQGAPPPPPERRKS